LRWYRRKNLVGQEKRGGDGRSAKKLGLPISGKVIGGEVNAGGDAKKKK